MQSAVDPVSLFHASGDDHDDYDDDRSQQNDDGERRGAQGPQLRQLPTDIRPDPALGHQLPVSQPEDEVLVVAEQDLVKARVDAHRRRRRRCASRHHSDSFYQETRLSYLVASSLSVSLYLSLYFFACISLSLFLYHFGPVFSDSRYPEEAIIS